MKKLMTMLAAAAMAFGLYAEGEAVNKTDFSGLASGSSLNVLADDNGETGTGMARFWTYTSATPADDALLIKNDTTPEGAKDEANYLAFKTGSEAIYRNFSAQNAAVGGDPTKFGDEMTIPAEGLYSDTTIKFGAPADELAVVADAKFLASVIDETEAAEGTDKITDKATNLWVIGGCYVNGSIVNRAFRMAINGNGGEVAIDDAWLTANKRVVIKAYKDVGEGVPGFILYVGNNFATVKGWAPVENGSIDFDGYADVTAADYLGDSTKITQTYRYGLKQLLLPLASTLAKLTAVGFKGTGALDSIALGGVPEDLVEEFTDAVQMTVTVDAGFTAATYQIGAATAVPLNAGLNTIEFAPGANITVTAVYPAGKIVKWTLGEYDVTEDVVGNAYTINDATGGEALVIEASDAVAVAYDADGKSIGSYATIQDALNADGVAKVVLAKGETLTEAITIDGEDTITIDLAGQKISGVSGSEDQLAIINAKSSLKIVDSEGDGEIAPDTGYKAVRVGDASTAVTFADAESKAFYVKGAVVYADTLDKGAINVNGGFFSEKIDDAVLPEGKKWVKPGDYWTLGDVTYVAQIDTTKYETLKDAVDAANKAGQPATIEVIADAPEAMVMTNEVALTITVAEGMTVTLDPTIPANATYPFVVKANLTLNGTGTWLKTGGSASMFRVLAGKVTVTRGTFIGGNETEPGEAGPSSIIQAAAENTEIEVNGGTFKNFRTNSGRCVRADNTNTVVTIKGGSFYSGATGTVSADNLPVTANFGTSADNVKKHGGTVVIPGLVDEQPNEATFNMDETQFCAEGYKTKIVDPATVYSVVAIQYATLEIKYDTTIFSDVSVTNAAGAAVEEGQIDIDDVSAAVETYTLDTEKYDFDPTSVLAVGPFVQGETFTIELKATAKQTDPIPTPTDDTPTAVSNALEKAGIPVDNPIYKSVTTVADANALNNLLKANAITSFSALTSDQQANINDSFLVMDLSGSELFAAPVEIEVTKIEATTTAGTYTFEVEVTSGDAAVIAEQCAQALKDKVYVANAIGGANTFAPVGSSAISEIALSADGKTASFTIAYGDGQQGFMKILCTKDNMDK